MEERDIERDIFHIQQGTLLDAEMSQEIRRKRSRRFLLRESPKGVHEA